MEELYKYQTKLKDMDLEMLLEELEKQTEDSHYHKLSSRNEKLESECKNRAMLIKLQIVDKFKNM